MRLELSPTNPDTHECQSHREGKWIVYTCPKCPNYERRYNYETGQMKVRQAADPSVSHRGTSNNYDPSMIQRSLN
ncbi:MAG: hypothetical protein AAF433_19135 [Bacteroidota bacterium]